MTESREVLAGAGRRGFLKGLGALALGACTPSASPLPGGNLDGLDLALGHRLSAMDFPAFQRTQRVDILIVGGGVSGLGAAWQLARRGRDDFLLLEMASSPGGNSRSGASDLTEYPLGAHYLPLPGREARHVRELLAETGVLQGPADAGRPVYDERYLCATPQERLFREGLWEEGLLAQRGVSAEERSQQQQFQEQMLRCKRLRGRDGRRVFAVPMRLSSLDPEWRALDRQTFHDWLLNAGYRAPSLHWLANYACRDDYGTDYRQTSAWAGLHYFASRDGEAANAAPDCVLTSSGGNAWLVRHLAAAAGDRVQTGAFVHRLEIEKQGVAVDVWLNGEVCRFLAARVIWAAPHFVLARVWRNAPAGLAEHLAAASYAPWLVANLHVSAPLQERHGAPPAWDNVIEGGLGLGYVDAMHQQIRRAPGATVLTWYRAFSEMPPSDARRLLRDTGHRTWSEQVLNELARVLPDIRTKTQRIDFYRNGHAMRRPLPGSLFGGARERLLAFRHPRLALAHADLSGFSLFEEALDRGVCAADALIRA